VQDEIPGEVRGVWGASSTNVFVAGATEAVLHYDGVSWAPMEIGTQHSLAAIGGLSAADVFAAGEDGVVMRYGE
jgi:hypothetical protein